MNTGPLASLSVVEWAGDVPGTFCGKLLADLGAEVIKVEPPAGDPIRQMGPYRDDKPDPEASALFLYLNNNKLGVTLDMGTADGQRIFHRLLDRASILVTDHPVSQLTNRHLEHEDVLRAHPNLIFTHITPFGLSGPHKDYKTSELISFHMSGYGHATPGTVDDPAREPPLKAGGRQADYSAGLTAAIGSMHGMFTSLQTGRGQVVDVSRQESLISFNISNLGTYSFAGQTPVRHKGGKRSALAITANLPCSDGTVFFVAMADEQWERLIEVLGNPDWARWEVFSDRFARAENWDALEPLMFEETRRFKMDEFVAICQAKRIPCLPINSIADVVESPQLASREFFITVEHPVMGEVVVPRNPLLFSGTPLSIIRPAPLLGEHNDLVLRERLGYEDNDISALRAAGVIS